MERLYSLIHQWRLLLITTSLWFLFGVLMAQDYSRVAPQVTNGTILIDRNADVEKLKDQLLFISRNIDNEEARTYALIFESVKENLGSSNISDIKNANFLTEISKLLRDKDESIKNSIDNNPNYSVEIKDSAKAKVGTLASEIGKDPFLKKVSKMIEIYTQLNRVNRNSKERLQSYVDFLLGLGNVFEIPEVDRVKGIADIIFTMQNILESLRIELQNKDSKTYVVISKKMNEGKIEISRLATEQETINEDVVYWLLDTLKPVLKNELIQHLGRESEAVQYFDILYQKLYTAIDNLKSQTDKEAAKLQEVFKLFFERKVSDIAFDFNLLERTSQIDWKELKTSIGKLFFEQHEAVRTQAGKTSEVAVAFLKEYYLNFLIDLIGNTANDKLKSLKNPTKIAWLNNFNVSDSASELSTTITYRIINRKKFMWEASLNVYYNTAKANTQFDSAKSVNPITRHAIIGNSLKWALHDKFEVGALIGVSSDFLGNLSNINATAPSLYSGINLAWKPSCLKGVILRPFAEYEVRRKQNKNSNQFWNFGIEFKFPDKFIISSIFVSHRKSSEGPQNSGSSIGITFPIIK